MTKTLTIELNRYRACEKGATAIEYSILAAATGLAIAPFMPQFRAAFSYSYGTIAAKLK